VRSLTKEFIIVCGYSLNKYALNFGIPQKNHHIFTKHKLGKICRFGFLKTCVKKGKKKNNEI